MRNIFTKKDRKIANLKVMIKHRDEIIDELNKENEIIREANKELRFENEEQRDIMKEIYDLVTSNTYNSEKIILAKIKEVITDRQINK